MDLISGRTLVTSQKPENGANLPLEQLPQCSQSE